MKFKVFSLGVFAAFVLSAAVQAGAVRVSVQEKGSHSTDPKDKNSVTQEKQLTIKLDNLSRDNLEGLKVKYTFFGKNVEGKLTTPLKSGETTASIPPGGTVTVQSEKTTATLVDKHMIKGKLVPAKGEKLSGYGVEVFNGTTQVGEFYSSPELKLKASGSAAQ